MLVIPVLLVMTFLCTFIFGLLIESWVLWTSGIVGILYVLWWVRKNSPWR